MDEEVAVVQAGEAVEASLEGASEVAPLEEEALPVAGSLQRTKHKGGSPHSDGHSNEELFAMGASPFLFWATWHKPYLTHAPSSGQ